MIIFAIDTSQAASLALVDTDSGEILASEQAEDQRRHVEFIGPALERVLSHPVAPDLVVTGIGPGPFTGLRVGIAAGIAVAAARGIEVRGLHSHAALAEEFRLAGSTAGPVLVAGDARRKEVYFSVYGPVAEAGPLDENRAVDAEFGLLAGPFVARPAEVAEVLAEAGFALQEGESPDLRVIENRIGRGFLLYQDILGAPRPAEILDPRAGYLALAAAHDPGELGEPIPEYLREPDAQAAPARQSTLK